MAPAVGPLRARVLAWRARQGRGREPEGCRPARRAGKEGETFRIAFAGGEGVAEADHQTVSRRDRHARLRPVWRCPRDSRLTGDGLGIPRVGGDDDAELPAIARDFVAPAWSARCVAATNCRGSAVGGDGAAKLHWHDCPAAASGSKMRTIHPGGAHIVAPDGAAVMQPAGPDSSRSPSIPSGSASRGRSRTRRLAQPRRSSSRSARPAAAVPPRVSVARSADRAWRRRPRPIDRPPLAEVASLAELGRPEARAVHVALELLRRRAAPFWAT